MAKIKILKNTVCGSKFVKKGDVVEASAEDAHALTRMGKAEEAKATKAKGKDSKD